MKISKIIDISIRRIKRNKRRNMMLMLPLIIILILLFISNMIQYSLEKYIENMESSLELRTITGINYTLSQYEQTVQKIQKIEHVQMVVGEFESHIFASKYCKQFATDKTDGKIEIKPTNNEACPEVIEGRKINEHDKYVIIIPSKIYADTVWETFENKIQNKQYIKGKELIGKTITVEFETTAQEKSEKTFKVIGIYDSDKYYENSNTYVPISTIKELNEELGHEASYFQLQIVVDKFENVEKVENILQKEGIIKQSQIQQEAEMGGEMLSTTKESNIASITHISAETQRLLKTLVCGLVIASLIILGVVLIVTNINKTYLSITEVAILKVEGYTNKDIQKITIIENIIICLISIVIALIGIEITKLIANLIFNTILQKEMVGVTIGKTQEQIYYITKIPQKISVAFVAFVSIFMIIIESLNTYWANKRILSKSIREMLEK